MKRSFENEILDDFSIQDSRVDNALIELSIINKFLGGRSTTRIGIKKLIKSVGKKENLRFLDIGAGGSDSLIDFANEYNVVSLDKNRRACLFIRDRLANGVICGDAFALPFKDNSFDISHASLFLHHFNDQQIIKILTELIRVSQSGIVINDLQRSIFAYAGIKILTSLFSKSKEVRYDAPLSVKRGFVKSELRDLMKKLSVNRYLIRSLWAFRWLVVIKL